jgi:hypothetical protein
MNYHCEDGSIVSFPTCFIAKIIDYGRCFFDGALAISNIVCNSTECDAEITNNTGLKETTHCGVDFGFSSVFDNLHDTVNNNTSDFFWINSTRPNRSHDLRFCANNDYIIKQMYPNLFNSIEYIDKYGTPENIHLPYSSTEKNVRNVSDMRICLTKFLTNWHTTLNEQYYQQKGYSLAGTMDIFSDERPYTFTVNL